MSTDHAKKWTCAAKSGLQKDIEENKLYPFLMGLNETYEGVRSNLLMMKPLPSLDSAYNVLLQDEGQRQVNPNSQFSLESASFNVSSYNQHQPKSSINQDRPSSSNFNSNKVSNNSRLPNNSVTTNSYNQSYNQSGFPRQNNQRVNHELNKSELYCRYCKKFGHLIQNCLKLKRKTAAIAEVESHSSSDVSVQSSPHQPTSFGSTSALPSITEEQYKQLMSILQQTHVSDSSQQHVMASANFAGPFNEEAIGSW